MNYLTLNAVKITEMVLDPRSVRDHGSVVIHDTHINQVCSYKNLCVHLDSLSWKVHRG